MTAGGRSLPRSFSRTSLAWFVIAGLAFAVAVSLTMAVTWVDGGVLERGRSGGGMRHFQHLGVFVPSDTEDDLEAFYVLYSEYVGDGEAMAMFSVPGEDVAVLLVSGLAGRNACLIDQTVRPPLVPRKLLIRPVSWAGIPDLYAVLVPAGETQIVECRMTGRSLPWSFTTRRLSIAYPSDQIFADLVSDPSDPVDQAFNQAVANADLQGVTGLKFDLNDIEGAANMRFAGSFETGDLIVGGTWRLLTPGEFMDVSWDDIYRQQFRDILLIVIGTLIGIGVTVMIEGLRPLIERDPAP